jgi:hypothetical protein
MCYAYILQGRENNRSGRRSAERVFVENGAVGEQLSRKYGLVRISVHSVSEFSRVGAATGSRFVRAKTLTEFGMLIVLANRRRCHNLCHHQEVAPARCS